MVVTVTTDSLTVKLFIFVFPMPLESRLVGYQERRAPSAYFNAERLVSSEYRQILNIDRHTRHTHSLP